jgi:hypothetical protein
LGSFLEPPSPAAFFCTRLDSFLLMPAPAKSLTRKPWLPAGVSLSAAAQLVAQPMCSRIARLSAAPAHCFTVNMCGALEFWHVTEHGKALIMAVARDYWAICEEQK